MSIGTTVSTNISSDLSYKISTSGSPLCAITLTPGVWMIHGSITWADSNVGPIITGIDKISILSFFPICNSTVFLNVPPYNQSPPKYPAYQTVSVIDKVVYSNTYVLKAYSPNGIGDLAPYDTNNRYPIGLYATRIA